MFLFILGTNLFILMGEYNPTQRNGVCYIAESARSCCACMHYCKDLYHATQMEGSHSVAALPYSIQPVVALVKMEGHSMKQPVHVTVQTVTVGTPVEVSALHGNVTSCYSNEPNLYTYGIFKILQTVIACVRMKAHWM